MLHLFEGSLFQLYYIGVDHSRCGHVGHVSAVRKRAPGHANFSRIIAPITNLEGYRVVGLFSCIWVFPKIGILPNYPFSLFWKHLYIKYNYSALS